MVSGNDLGVILRVLDSIREDVVHAISIGEDNWNGLTKDSEGFGCNYDIHSSFDPFDWEGGGERQGVYEYEMFFKSKKKDFVVIDGWIPISTDSIDFRKLDRYIKNGLIRKIK